MGTCPSNVVGSVPRFKAEAVQMVIDTGKPIAEVARDLGIHDGTLGNWVNTWRREHPEPEPTLNPVNQTPSERSTYPYYSPGS